MARIGIKDLFIAPIKVDAESTYTAGAPIRVGKMATLDKEYKGNAENTYYDDSLDEVIDGNVGKSLKIGVKEIPLDVESLINGTRIIKGMEMGSTEDVAGLFAVGYRARNQKGQYTLYWHYVCKAMPLSEKHETKADKVKINNRELEFTIMDRKKVDIIGGKEVKLDHVQLDESILNDTDTDAKKFFEIDPTTKTVKWFSAVPEPIAA